MSKLQDELKKIEKQYGDNVIAKSGVPKESISTGSLNLNAALGNGGYVRGTFVEMFAWEGVGKSTLGLHAVAEGQALGLTCAFIDSEHALDEDYATAIGVDVEKLIHCRPTLLEEALNIAIRLIKTDEVQVIVLDSLSAMLPTKEFEGEIGDSTMGVKARLVGAFCRNVKPLLKNHKVLLITIGQLRDKITMYGDPTTTDYGNAPKFFADVRIKLTKSLEKDGDQVVGNNVTATILKNKLAKPFQKAEFPITFGIGIDKFEEIMNMVIEKGIVTRAGSWFSYGDIKIGQGSEKVKTFLLDNPELFEEIKSKL